MNILAAIKREERKLEIQLGKLQKQLEGVSCRKGDGEFSRSGAIRDKKASSF